MPNYKIYTMNDFSVEKVLNPLKTQPFFINQEKSFISLFEASACQNILFKQKKQLTLLNRKHNNFTIKVRCYE